MKTALRIWTDGCCLRNPGGPGGWAFVAERSGQVLATGSGGEGATTNNRMELLGVIEGLRWVDGAHTFEVVSDSRYVVNGATSWMHGWKRKGWRKGRKGGGDPVKNADLWQMIDELLIDKHRVARVTFSWVKGHANHEFNEMADLLAGQAARRPPTDPAEAFLARHGL